MWYFIIGALMLTFGGGLLYISFRSARFSFVKRLTGNRRWLGRLLCLVFYLALAVFLWRIWNLMNALVCFVHLFLFWLICDGIGAVICKVRHTKPERYRAGAAAFFLCILYLAAGWYADHHVWVRNYSFTTDQFEGSLRIVQLTDSHLGATFDAEGFGQYIDEINALSPDVVVVTGDFVDDDTSREDMLGGCEALGQLKTKYGVYFVYGNHDMVYFSEAAKGWKNAELQNALEQNGVVILEDEPVTLFDGVVLAGRRDRSYDRNDRSRLTAEALLRDVEKENYVILLDHQPYDFDAEAEAGADLVLCGHTHGGQFIPINYVGEWTGENCLRYGHEKRGDTDFIVSSGISNWTFRFKTGCWSEYVVVDIRGS